MKSNTNNYHLQLVIKNKLGHVVNHKKTVSAVHPSNNFANKIDKYIDQQTQKTQETYAKKHKASKSSFEIKKNTIKIPLGQNKFYLYVSGKTLDKKLIKVERLSKDQSWKSFSQSHFIQKSFLQTQNFMISGTNVEYKPRRQRIQSSSQAHDLKIHSKQRPRVQTAHTKSPLSFNPNSSQRVLSSKSRLSKLSSQKDLKGKMIFNPTDYEQQYRKRLQKYLEFLYKINYSNSIQINFQLSPLNEPIQRYSIYVQKGCNSLVIQHLKRRFWFQIKTEYQPECYLYWTSNHLNIHQYQRSSLKQGHKTSELKNFRQPLSYKFISIQQNEQVDHIIKQKGFIQFSRTSDYNLMTSHIPGTRSLTNRAKLIKNLKHYYEDVLDENPFKSFPRSYLIKSFRSPEMDYMRHLIAQSPKKIWIVRPSGGQNLLLQAQNIEKSLNQLQEQGISSFVIQQYIRNPLLYNNRKWDIRHFVVLQSINGKIKAFWFRDGYIRTSCKVYQFQSKINCRNPLAKKYKAQMSAQMGAWLKDSAVHFTDDQTQKEQSQYGRFQKGNKLSYIDIQKYFDRNHNQFPFKQRILSKMKELACDAIKSVIGIIDLDRKNSNFQILAFDFIVDSDFNVWLLNVKDNSFPTSNSPVIDRVVPSLIQHTIRFVIQPLMPPKNHFPPQFRSRLPPDSMESLKFQLMLQF